MSEQIQVFFQNDLILELLFWLGFLFFNFSLFAFNYFINFKEADFFPFLNIRNLHRIGVFISPNPDFFRFSVDLSILMLLVRFGIIWSGFFIISAYYGFLIIFNTYHYLFLKIYQVNPVILNDLKLLKNGAGILWNESKLKIIVSVSLLIATTVLLSIFFNYYLSFAQTLSPNLFCNVLTAAIFFLFVIALAKRGYKHDIGVWHRYLIHLLRIGGHIVESFKLHRKSNMFNHEILIKHRKLLVNLNQKPNVFILFVESYGSILLKDPELSEPFKKKFKTFKSELKDSDWGCKSNYSTSVSLVGPSWLAYTSVLLGTQVNTNFYYEYLLNEKRYNEFDTLTKVLQNHGYYAYNLNATKFINGVNVPLQRMKEFFGYDRFVLTDDIAFWGTKYGFTESPPDQYVLNYMHEQFLKSQTDPFVLFYLTKNSHNPFITPDFAENWNDLNKTPDTLIGDNFLQNPNLEDYMKSMDYQLDFIQDFIVRNGNDNDIFLLVGDHQPHGLCTQEDGTETLVHVLSRDTKFLSEFEQYGFRESIQEMTNPVKHEALYSIFLRSFIKTYGEDNQPLPDYEPDGLQL